MPSETIKFKPTLFYSRKYIQMKKLNPIVVSQKNLSEFNILFMSLVIEDSLNTILFANQFNYTAYNKLTYTLLTPQRLQHNYPYNSYGFLTFGP